MYGKRNICAVIRTKRSAMISLIVDLLATFLFFRRKTCTIRKNLDGHADLPIHNDGEVYLARDLYVN